MVTKEFMKDNKRFADAFNYCLFGGRQLVDPDTLTELDTTELFITKKIKDAYMAQKFRDVLRCTTLKENDQACYVILGIENQTAVDNTMVARNMLYDAIQYFNQIRSGSPYIKPVITIVIYYGIGEWTGSRSLYDMIDPKLKNGVGQEYLKYVSDYKIKIIEPCINTFEELSQLQTDLKYVLSYLKATYECKERGVDMEVLLSTNPILSRITRDSAYVIDELTDSNYVACIDKEGEVNMNIAWKYIGNAKYNEGKAEGEAKGRAEGEAKGKAEGRLEETVRIVKNLLKAKEPDEYIREVVEISQTELDAIKARITNEGNKDATFNFLEQGN